MTLSYSSFLGLAKKYDDVVMYSTRPVGSVEVVLTTFDTARHHREELDGHGGLDGEGVGRVPQDQRENRTECVS